MSVLCEYHVNPGELEALANGRGRDEDDDTADHEDDDDDGDDGDDDDKR